MDEPGAFESMIFAKHAGNDVARWREIIGHRVVHSRFGIGEVISIRQGYIGDVIVSVRFVSDCQPIRDLSSTIFLKLGGLAWIDLPFDHSGLSQAHSDMVQEQFEAEVAKELERRLQSGDARQRESLHAEIKAQWRREAEARREFAELKRRYEVAQYVNPSPTCPLYPILLSLDAKQPLSANQCSWLEGESLLGPLAYNAELMYERSKDAWQLVKASRWWRQARLPFRAIQSTNVLRTISRYSVDLQSALLTTRGAALRDVGRLAGAEQCARRAIAIQPEGYYAYNLLGGIYFDLGDPGAGYASFEKATALGSSPKPQRLIIQGSMNKLAPELQRSTAEYLLKMDPEHFAWATNYLK